MDSKIIIPAMMVFLIVSAGCNSISKDPNQVELNVTDTGKVKISGTYLQPEYAGRSSDAKSCVLLLHMLGSDRSAYAEIAQELALQYKVLSIDFRGHGESSQNWKTFNDKQMLKLQYDISAAHKFLNGKGCKNIAIIGASIGANLAIKYAANDTSTDIKTLVLLSPGLDYRGISIETDARKIRGKPVLIIASTEDRYSAESSAVIATAVGSDTAKFDLHTGLGHGTNMLASRQVWQEITNWINTQI